MESVLLAVALLGFGIGGYFVVGRVARFFAIGPPAGPPGEGQDRRSGRTCPGCPASGPPPGAGEAREKGGKSSRLAG